jgi:small GTP-binding protein
MSVNNMFAKYAAEFVSDVFQNLYSQGFFNQLFSELFGSNKKILVLGDSGAGKTQFINTFSEKLRELEVFNRTNAAVKTYAKVDGFSVKFFDTPGEIAKSQIRNKEIKEMVSKQNYEGIINVVSYGYAEREDDKQFTFDKNNQLNLKKLEDKRKAEIELLDDWMKYLDVSKVKWVITLITKADIWWDNLDDVYNYYLYGAYRRAIDDAFYKYRYPQMTYFMPFCSIQKPFYNEMHSQNFTELNRNNLVGAFTRELATVMGKEQRF